MDLRSLIWEPKSCMAFFSHHLAQIWFDVPIGIIITVIKWLHKQLDSATVMIISKSPGLAYLYPRHTKYVGVYSFRFFIRSYIRSFVRPTVGPFVRLSVTGSKFLR